MPGVHGNTSNALMRKAEFKGGSCEGGIEGETHGCEDNSI